MSLDHYDTKNQSCLKCERHVDIKTSKANKPYMVNPDGSYHIVFKDGEHCAGNKPEVEYIQEHGSLDGYVANSGSPPEQSTTSEAPSGSLKILQDSDVGTWFLKHWDVAKAAATEMGANSVTNDHRIAAAGVMHDFATLEMAKEIEVLNQLLSREAAKR